MGWYQGLPNLEEIDEELVRSTKGCTNFRGDFGAFGETYEL